jgi:putative ABC transport system permease protein
MPTLPKDLRYAFRSLMRTPGFAAIAILTLALGIGANTAIFSIIDSVLLRPLPYPNPDRLARLFETEAAPGHYPFAGPDFMDWRAQNHTFEDMALFGWPSDINLSENGRPDHVAGIGTQANFFRVMGVTPLLGRAFADGEDQPGKNRVVVLSHALWRTRFASDPKIVGRTLDLNARKYTVVGVMPDSFRFPSRAELWTPLELDAKGLRTRGSHWLNAVGRMKPGVSVKTAQADLAVIAANLEKTYPDSNDKVGAAVEDMRENLVGNSRKAMMMMLAAVALVLLIACANVANLLLSRAVTRQKEMAVRSALGAGRGRLVRQLLTESMLLAMSGGALGVALAWALVRSFAAAQSFALPRYNALEINFTVLAFAFLLAALTGALFGIVPALQTSRPNLHEELKGGAGSSISPSRRRRWMSNALVVGEVALSLLLLVSAGMLLKDFTRLRYMDFGVRTEGVWTASVQLPQANYKGGPEQFRFAETLRRQVAGMGGVVSVAMTDRLPLEGGSNYYVSIRGQADRSRSGILVENHSVSPDYFKVMGIRLLEGRTVTQAETEAVVESVKRIRALYEGNQRPPAEATNGIVVPVVINQTMVRTFWPNRSALGEMFSNGGPNGPWRQVVGVVSDVRQWGLTEKPKPEAYDPYTGDSRPLLVVRSALPPTALAAGVRRELARVDGSLPLISPRTMDEVAADSVRNQRFLSLLVGSFAALAALLAAVGMYGVLSYAVTQRTREIGIRLSLGATRERVLGQIVKDGMILAAAGFVIGVASALATGKLLANLLNEVRPGDPAVYIATGTLLAAVALTACWLPARRAARLDPMTALRYE